MEAVGAALNAGRDAKATAARQATEAERKMATDTVRSSACGSRTRSVLRRCARGGR
jgi:hypothetical protein